MTNHSFSSLNIELVHDTFVSNNDGKTEEATKKTIEKETKDSLDTKRIVLMPSA